MAFTKEAEAALEEFASQWDSKYPIDLEVVEKPLAGSGPISEVPP